MYSSWHAFIAQPPGDSCALAALLARVSTPWRPGQQQVQDWVNLPVPQQEVHTRPWLGQLHI
jgi:hypothetical protein